MNQSYYIENIEIRKRREPERLILYLIEDYIERNTLLKTREKGAKKLLYKVKQLLYK